MKSFFKRTFASCLGTLLALFVVCLSILIIVTILYTKEKPNQKGILHLELSGSITDYSQMSFNPTKFDFNAKSTSLWDIKNKIKAASEDKNISGLFIEAKSTDLSQTIALEILNEIANFKENGKNVYAYSNYYGQNVYLLSTVADSLFLNPGGGIDLKGYAIFAPFFTNLLQKFKVDVNIFSAGKYKGAVEPYKLDEFSKDNRFQLQTYLDHSESELIKYISKNRKLEEKNITEVLEKNGAYKATENLENGLVDRIAYRDEFDKSLKLAFGTDKLVKFSEYKVKLPKVKNAETALVFMEGEIIWGKSETGAIGHESYSEIFQKIREDDNIKNVVLRINSPGGNGFASDIIRRELLLLNQKGKRIITSIGGMAASGAYYIASLSDTIISNPNSLTGSIGVYIMFPTFDRLINETLDINIDSVSSAENTITFSPYFEVSETQKERLKDETQNLYNQFLEVVSTGRGISIDSSNQIAQGRMWTGSDALKIGLVDVIGDLDYAINLATNQIDNPRIIVYPQHKASLTEEIIQQSIGSMEVELNSKYKSFLQKAIEIEHLIKNPSPMMRIPFNNFVTKR